MFVVSEVVVTWDDDGNPDAGSGVPKVYQPWTPTSDALHAVGYEHDVLSQVAGRLDSDD